MFIRFTLNGDAIPIDQLIAHQVWELNTRDSVHVASMEVNKKSSHKKKNVVRTFSL